MMKSIPTQILINFLNIMDQDKIFKPDGPG